MAKNGKCKPTHNRLSIFRESKNCAVLNQLSAFWFNRFGKIDNHFVTSDFDTFPKLLRPFREQLAGRSMIVKKTKPLPVECVVRGYLAGSGWKEYQESQ